MISAIWLGVRSIETSVLPGAVPFEADMAATRSSPGRPRRMLVRLRRCPAHRPGKGCGALASQPLRLPTPVVNSPWNA